MFTEKDTQQIKRKGIDIETIEKQIEYYKKGFPFSQLVAPATPGDGIILLSKEEIETLIKKYDTGKHGKRVLKFVPASGAASRMFKNLFSFKDKYNNTDEDYKKLIADNSFDSPWNLFRGLSKMALFEDLKLSMQKDGLSYEQCVNERKFNLITEYILESKGLDYAALPKGLLKFHVYNNGTRTSFEEHLVEGALYAANDDKTADIHFTVSPDHTKKFTELLYSCLPAYEMEYGVQYAVSFSIQKPSTDMLAVDMNNNPFRDNDGTLLFRPGGHGALIENLNDLNADVIFIKNIDNVVPDRLKQETINYKKAIGGLLIELKEQADAYLKQLECGEHDNLEQIKQFAQDKLLVKFDESFNTQTVSQKALTLFNLLNKPLRICGMVKNEGEPGGGPFWVKDSRNITSLQIVEGSQIDMQNPAQVNILKNATHFNPVDLVCSIKDYKGNMFNLKDFVDPQTGFISTKSKDGKDLKAMELPGLWNGAMAYWNTLFVEVPLITFNPVKTINDLLREQHQ